MTTDKKPWKGDDNVAAGDPCKTSLPSMMQVKRSPDMSTFEPESKKLATDGKADDRQLQTPGVKSHERVEMAQQSNHKTKKQEQKHQQHMRRELHQETLPSVATTRAKPNVSNFQAKRSSGFGIHTPQPHFPSNETRRVASIETPQSSYPSIPSEQPSVIPIKTLIPSVSSPRPQPRVVGRQTSTSKPSMRMTAQPEGLQHPCVVSVPTSSLSPVLLSSYLAIDAHCHLNRLYRKVSCLTWEVLVQQKILVISNEVDPTDHWRKPWESRAAFNTLYTIGCHPHDARDLTECHWNFIEIAAGHPKIVAIGQTGLSNLDCAPSERGIAQCQLFMKHLQLAVTLDKALVLCCSNADPRVILHTLYKKAPLHMKMHWQSLDELSDFQVKKCVERFPNMYFGIGTTLLGAKGEEERKYLEMMVPLIPRSRVMLESDAPHLEVKGQAVNTPAVIVQVAEELARIWKSSLSFVLALTKRNTVSLYKL